MICVQLEHKIEGVTMMRRFTFVLSAVLYLLIVSACSATPKETGSASSNHAEESNQQETNQNTAITVKDETETKNQAVSECISEFFEEESVSALSVKDQKIEVKIEHPETAGDTPPDDWNDICENFDLASAALQDRFSGDDVKNIILQLVDPNKNIMLTVLNGKTSYTKYETFEYAEYNPPTMSLAEFNAITNGMNVQEVADIVGSSGTLISEVDLGLGYSHRTLMFQWDGEGSIGANANVTFQGGEVISKAQFGLE